MGLTKRSDVKVVTVTVTVTTSCDMKKNIKESKNIILYIILYYDLYIYIS